MHYRKKKQEIALQNSLRYILIAQLFEQNKMNECMCTLATFSKPENKNSLYAWLFLRAFCHEENFPAC